VVGGTEPEFRQTAVECTRNSSQGERITGHGRTKPTPYEDECYSLLASPNPTLSLQCGRSVIQVRKLPQKLGPLLSMHLNKRESTKENAHEKVIISLTFALALVAQANAGIIRIAYRV